MIIFMYTMKKFEFPRPSLRPTGLTINRIGSFVENNIQFLALFSCATLLKVKHGKQLNEMNS